MSRQSSKKGDLDATDTRLIKNVQKIVGDMKGLVLSIDASHTGYMNKNFRNYTDNSYRKAHKSLYIPYPKPILRGHNMISGIFGPEMQERDALGRIHDAAFIPGIYKRADGQTANGLLKAGAFIPEGDETDKIKTGIHLTTSIGFNRKSSVCSICGFDWWKYKTTGNGWQDNDPERDSDDTCDHTPGKVYKVGKGKKQAFWYVDVNNFNEVSVTTSPADMQSMIMAYAEAGVDTIEDVNSFLDVEYMADSGLNYICQDVNYGTGIYTVSKPDSDALSQDDEEEQLMNELEKKVDALNDMSASMKDTLAPLANLPALLESLKPKQPDPPPTDSKIDGSDTTPPNTVTLQGEDLKSLIHDAVKAGVQEALIQTKDGASDVESDPAGGTNAGSKDAEKDGASESDEIKALKDQIDSLTKERNDLKKSNDELNKKLSGKFRNSGGQTRLEKYRI